MLKISKIFFFIGNNLEFSTHFSCALEQSSVKGPITDDCFSAQDELVEKYKLFPIIRIVQFFFITFWFVFLCLKSMFGLTRNLVNKFVA